MASFKQGHYLEPLVMASISLESNLRKALLKKKTNLHSNSSLGELIRAAEKFQLLKNEDIESLRKISYLRNIAVHQGDTPDPNTVEWILDISKLIIDKLVQKESGSSCSNNFECQSNKPARKGKFVTITCNCF